MYLLKLAFIFVLTFVFIKLIIKNAKFLGLVDIPNERSSHIKITPRGAGIGFGFAFFITNLFFSFDLFIEQWIVYLAIFMVFLLGILDDHKDTTPKIKFYVIFLATFILYLDDISIYSLGTFLGVEIHLSYFALPFSMIAVAGFTNALNLIDGLDGLAASISIVILSSFLYIGYFYADTLIINLCLTTIISLFAFLFFNWNPAKIFMGDSGSLFLGFIIAVVAILSLEYIHPVAVLYLAALPLMDTLIVMVRRIRKGKSPFIPDKTHIHHILLNFFQKRVRKTVGFLVLLQTIFSLMGLMFVGESKVLSFGLGFISLLAFIGINVIFYMIFTGMKRRQKLIEKLALRQIKNKEK